MTHGAPMLARQRQDVIVERLHHSGAVRVQQLTAELGVSDMTIRRDLDALVDQGVAEKVHGGATLAKRATSDEPSFASKSLRELTEKAAIARAAAPLVTPGSAVALSAGTTTLSLARELTTVPDLTIVTNSMRIADVFSGENGAGHTVVLTGGIRTPSEALVGPVAERSIRSLHVDTLFIGCHGLDARAGLSTPNLAESETNKQFIHSAHRIVVVADHTKWGVIGLSSFADLRDVHVLVTDAAIPAPERDVATEAIGRVIVADQREPGPDTPFVSGAAS